MRSLCACLAFTFLAGVLACSAPGCGGGGSGLEKVPEVKAQNPETDMPGFKDMQDKMKKK